MTFWNKKVVVLCTGIFAACGTPPTGPDASMSDVVVSEAGDSGVSADVSDSAIADAAADAGGNSCPTSGLLITTSDGMTGGYLLGSFSPLGVAPVMAPAGAMVPQDHVVRVSGCMVFDLWRTSAVGANQIQVLNPRTPYMPMRTITLPPVSAGGMMQPANPYDIAVLSPTKAYVALYNANALAIVNPMTGMVTGQLSLAPLTDSDGVPEATGIAVVGNRAFVLLQQLNRNMGYAPPANSTVAVVDTATDQLVDADSAMDGVQGVRLNYGNPQSYLVVPEERGSSVAVVSTGGFDSNVDGGIDWIDTTRMRVTRSVSSRVFGADPNGFVQLSGGQIVVLLPTAGDGGMGSALRAYDLGAGVPTLLRTIAEVRGVTLGGLRLASDGSFWAINTAFGANGAVYGFRPDGRELLSPPFSIASTGTYSMEMVP